MSSSPELDGVTLAELYRTPAILTFEDEAELFADAVTGNVAVLSVGTSWDKENIFGWGEGGSVAPPSCLIALVTARPDRLDLLFELREDLSELGLGPLTEPQVVSPEQAGDTLSLLGVESADILVAQARMIANLTREVGHLRRRHETLQNQFHDLEAVLDRQGLQPCDLVFEALPGTGRKRESGVSVDGNAPLSQILPVASRGILAFALHVLERGSPTARLSLTLRTLEDGATVGTWTVPADALKTGWNSFALTRSLGGLRRTLSLDLALTGDGAAPRLALGAVQPVPKFRVTGTRTGKPQAGRHLALRIWAGMPGLLAPDWLSGAALKGGERVVLDHVLRAACVVGSAAPGPVSLRVGLHDRSLNLRDLPAGETTILVPDAVPAGTRRVTARVIVPVDGCAASVVMVVMEPAGQNPDESRLQEIGRSEPIRLPPGGEARLNLFLADVPTAACSLYLVVRALDDAEPIGAAITIRSITILTERLPG